VTQRTSNLEVALNAIKVLMPDDHIKRVIIDTLDWKEGEVHPLLWIGKKEKCILEK